MDYFLIFKKPAQNKQSPNLVTLTAGWKIPFKLEDNVASMCFL
jgi:hypothetical protein